MGAQREVVDSLEGEDAGSFHILGVLTESGIYLSHSSQCMVDTRFSPMKLSRKTDYDVMMREKPVASVPSIW